MSPAFSEPVTCLMRPGPGTMETVTGTWDLDYDIRTDRSRQIAPFVNQQLGKQSQYNRRVDIL